jgi:GNAT superfamily N-acetyltransferase
MAIRIVTISENPALIPQIARWLWAEWASRKGRTLQMVTNRLAARAAAGGPEQTFVTLDDATPLATASYVAADLVSRPDLTPWLASVFVDKPHRGHGHAANLVRRVEQAARAAGTEPLWLHTEHAEGLYARLGWELVGQERDHGSTVTLMRRQLTPTGQ